MYDREQKKNITFIMELVIISTSDSKFENREFSRVDNFDKIENLKKKEKLSVNQNQVSFLKAFKSSNQDVVNVVLETGYLLIAWGLRSHTIQKFKISCESFFIYFYKFCMNSAYYSNNIHAGIIISFFTTLYIVFSVFKGFQVI